MRVKRGFTGVAPPRQMLAAADGFESTDGVIVVAVQKENTRRLAEALLVQDTLSREQGMELLQPENGRLSREEAPIEDAFAT